MNKLRILKKSKGKWICVLVAGVSTAMGSTHYVQKVNAQEAPLIESTTVLETTESTTMTTESVEMTAEEAVTADLSTTTLSESPVISTEVVAITANETVEAIEATTTLEEVATTIEAVTQSTEVETAATALPVVAEETLTPNVDNNNLTIGYNPRFGQYVSATDFGADITGQTDSLKAIKDALDFANANGYAVKLEGLLKISNQIKIDKGTYGNIQALFGDGSANTQVMFDKPQDGVFDSESNTTDTRDYAGILIDGVDNVTIANLAVKYTNPDFYRAANPYFGKVNGIQVNNSSNVTIDSVEVTGANRAGIVFTNTDAYKINPTSPHKTSYANTIARGEMSTTDPTLPIGKGNKVINSYLHHNRVAGVLFKFQRDFLVENNTLSYNGHPHDGGTGYGAASEAGSYNYGITFRNNTTQSNYRKGLDIHDGDHILIENNNLYGDRLHGIAVYNRAYIMTDVTIRNNNIVSNPSFRDFKNDNPKYTYNNYAGIQLMTNTTFKKWPTSVVQPGKYIIENNQISDIDIVGDHFQTFGIEFRSYEHTNDYHVSIKNNTISGKSTKMGIGIINNSKSRLGEMGLGTGSIDILNNTITFDEYGTYAAPIYLEETNSPKTLRGVVNINDNTIIARKGIYGIANGIYAYGNPKTMSALGNKIILNGHINRPDRPTIALMNLNPDSANKTLTFVTNNNIYSAESNYKRIMVDWVKVTNTLPVICDNYQDGRELNEQGCSILSTNQVESVATSELIREIRSDNSLPVGYREVVQTGTAEIIKTIYEVLMKDGQEVSRRILSQVVEVPPVTEIVLIGTGEVTKLTQTEDIYQDFEVKVVQNPNLPTDHRKVLVEGERGHSKREIEVTYINGKETERNTLSETPIIRVRDQIVEVGTGIVTKELVTVTETINFEDEIEVDKLKTNDYILKIRDGENGSADNVYEVTYLNGQEVGRVFVSKTITKDPINSLTIRGIGEVVRTEKQITETVEEFTREIRNDETKPVGYTEIIKLGQNGTIVREYLLSYDQDGNELKRELISEVKNPVPITEITVVGTNESNEYRETVSELINFNTIYREDNTKNVGYYEILEHGSNGMINRTYLIMYKDGQEDSRVLIDEEVAVESKPQIIIIGTKGAGKVTTESEEVEFDVPFNEKFIENNNLFVEESYVQKVGVLGKSKRSIIKKFIDGELVSETSDTVEVLYPPIDQVTVRGTLLVKEAFETLETLIPFEEKIVQDPTQPVGYENITQNGKNGTITRKYKVILGAKGEISREVVEEIIVDSIPLIKTIGTQRAIVEERVEQIEENIDFINKTKQIDNVPEFHQVILQSGIKGKQLLTYNVTYVDGVEVERKLIKTETIVQPQDEIIGIGTGVIEERETEEIVTIPTNSRMELSPDLAKGTFKILQEGKEGTITYRYRLIYKDGKLIDKILISETTINSIEEIVLVGTKVIESDDSNDKEGDYSLIEENNEMVESSRKVLVSPATILPKTGEEKVSYYSMLITLLFTSGLLILLKEFGWREEK